MNQITKSSFLSDLRKTRGSWSVTIQGMVRDDRGRCPIVAVAEDVYRERADGPTLYRRVAEAIGVDATLAEEIVFAADHQQPRLLMRDRMLEACGTDERLDILPPDTVHWFWDPPVSPAARWEPSRKPADAGAAASSTEAVGQADDEMLEFDAA